MRQILLLGHTHHDVGYTNSPRIVDTMHRRIVDHVLDLVDDDPSTGPDAFRWTFEAARPVIEFWRRADAADRARLLAAVEGGRISVTAGYLNMAQLSSDAEIDASYDALTPLRSGGITPRTQQHGDVNGLSWGSVDSMTRVGVRRLLMALNPDHGRPPLEQPSGFWWEGPSGDRIFTWLSTHYGYGEEWGIVDGDVETATARIEAYIARLIERDDYRFDTAIVHAGNDNRWPTTLFLDIVRHWNQAHPEMPMRTATVDQALDELESDPAAESLPVLRGEWADWWSHGHGSTARELSVYREARSFASVASSSLALAALRGEGDTELATVLGYRRGPVRLRSHDEIALDLEAVDEQLLLFAEHTWGSWETYSKPHSVFSHSHWNAKAGFAYAAYDHARDLALEGMFRLAASGGGPAELELVEPGTSILVVNPSPHRRTEPVTVEVKVGTNGVRMATLVADVPPFGMALIPVPESPTEAHPARVIENDMYRMEVDPDRGVVSILDLRSGTELIDRAAVTGLGSIVVDRIPEGSQHPMVTTNPKMFHPDYPGPDAEHHVARGTAEPLVSTTPEWTSITWSSSAPTVPTISSTVRIYHGLDVIDLEVSIVKPENFDPESIFIAFPFTTASPEFVLETAGAAFVADSEQLPDTSKDWYSIQHAVGVRGEGPSIMWTAQDAPLVQLGGIHTGAWARTLDAPVGHIYSWLMNNYHFTNFQARQEGTGVYRYRFASRPDGVSADDVMRAGREGLQRLFAREYAGPWTSAPSPVRLEPAGDLAAEWLPTAEGARLRVRNLLDSALTATISVDASLAATATSISLAPHGVAEVDITTL